MNILNVVHLTHSVECRYFCFFLNFLLHFVANKDIYISLLNRVSIKSCTYLVQLEMAVTAG